MDTTAAPVSRSMTSPVISASSSLTSPIRMLRLPQVQALTGLGKTKIYEMQAEGSFPMRIQITGHSVAWIEEEVQAWLSRRVQASTPLPTD